MSERLRQARIGAGFRSAMAAANSLGVKPSTYGAHENGRNNFGPDEAEHYGRRFHVSAAWLLTGEGRGPGEEETSYRQDGASMAISTEGRDGFPDDLIPQLDAFGGMGGGGVSMTVVSRLKSGQTIDADAITDYWRIPSDALSAMRVRRENIIAIPVKGDSMDPTIRSTDIVFIDVRHRHPSPDGVYALADTFGEIIVKRLTRTSSMKDDDPEFQITSDNPNHPARTERGSELMIFGRVIGRFTTI